jgi:HNH endonuclease
METLTEMSDLNLLASFNDLTIDERENLVAQLLHIGEMDRRKAFLDYPSLKALLVQENGMEDWVAERKIRAARLLRKFPEIQGLLESGKLNISLLEIAQGCAHREKLSDPECLELFRTVSGLSCRAARREIASLYPASEAELPRDQVRPLTEELSELRCVAKNEDLDTLEEIRGLLAHSHPELGMGELIGIIASDYRKRHHPEEAAKRALARKQKKQKPSVVVETPAAAQPENTERRTPDRSLTHELTWQQGYQCGYIDPHTQRRCTSAYALERDHIQAWADGGETELHNLRWLCRNHHGRVSFLRFGESSKYLRASPPLKDT